MMSNYEFPLLIFLVFLILRIPFIGKYLKIINTMVHESGHAFASLLTSGEVISIELLSNSEGITLTKSKSFFSIFLTSLAGYVFSSAISFVLFYLISVNKYDYIFYFFISLIIINIILWVRNIYGILWLISFGSFVFYISTYIDNDIKNIIFILISTIILSESIFSSLVILRRSFKKSKEAGDASNLKMLTHIPTFIWASFFLAQSLFFGYKSYQLYSNSSPIFNYIKIHII
jgi:hypothetical protein